MTTILIVDDEPNIVELARLYLEREGFLVVAAGTGEEALSILSQGHISLVVLDLMLPDIDGLEICREIRKKGDLPVLMLTARKEDVDKIVGLELGADDYLTKPFNPRELVARVKAVLRRYQEGTRAGQAIERGNLRIDIARREATVEGYPLTLRTKEFDLLVALMQNFEIVLTRDRLLESVWGTAFYGETRTVDIHINHIRDKLSGSNVNIETIRSVGYKMTMKKDGGPAKE